MTDQHASSFVRTELTEPRRAPVKTTGVVGFVRERLFSTPFNITLTIVSALLLWFTIVPAVKFLIGDAVWSGTDRTACLQENVGHVVGACWPFIQAKFDQFVYGFYPAAERWRVNLTFALGALLLNTINSALVVVNVSSFWSSAIAGGLLIGAIAFDRLIAVRVAPALRTRRSGRG